MNHKSALSLFSSAGIGDLALRSAGIEVIVANEILSERAELFKRNFPKTKMIVGDIRIVKNDIIDSVRQKLNGQKLDFLFATPPCQGMSKNGRGKLLSGIRLGLKPNIDERNLLILDVIEIANKLKPRIIVIENVPEMQRTVISDKQGNTGTIIDIMRAGLIGYVGKSEIIEFADYGIPQRRQRLITIFSNNINIIENLIIRKSILPNPTHSQFPSIFQKKWVSVLDVISDLPALDAKNKITASSNLPFHRVPVLDSEKYFWVSNTPIGKGAFDNQCVVCGFLENPTHSSSKDEEGINKTNKTTPIKCLRCSSLLPRPWVKKDGKEHRLMSGFTSAYKRMRGDLPASALTKNLSYACSDHKLHPVQNRVLSIHEACIIHTIAQFDYIWERQDKKTVSDKTIREVIGESIPPKGLELIFCFILETIENKNNISNKSFDVIISLKKINVA